MKFVPAVLLLATTFALAFFELSDYDIWYHLRAGELIPQNGVPQKDWFCFKSEEQDWIDVHWGFQRVAAELYGRFGSAGLVWMKSVAAVLAMAFALAAYKKGWPRSVQVLAWICPLLLMSSRFYERPEIFTLVFTAIYLHVLFHAEEHPGRLWVLPFVQAAWANVQGLFVFGPILLGMYWAEAVFRVDRVRGLFRHLMPVTLLVFAACVASPYGWRNLLLVMQISQTATSNLYRESIAELKSVPAVWKEGGYTEVFLWIGVATVAIAVVSTLLALPVIWRERRLFRVLPTIAFTYVGLQAIRNGNHAALVLGTVTCWNLGSLSWKPRPRWMTTGFATLVVGVLFYAVASEHWAAFATPTRVMGTGERANYYPREAMRKAGLPGAPMKALVMHNGHAALYEYLNYSPGTPRKTYADARLEVHSLQTYKNYLELCSLLKKNDGKGDSVLRSEGIDLASVDGDQYSEVQAQFFTNPEWVCVHFDEISALFLRADKPLPDGLKKWDPKEELFRTPTALEDMPMEIPSEPRWLIKMPSEVRKGYYDILAVRTGYVWDKLLQNSSAPPDLIRTWNMLSLQAARRAAVRRPWRAESYRQLGYAALGSSRPGITMATATELPDIVPIATAMFNFKRALQIDPNDFYSRMWLGQTYATLGEFDLAEKELLRLKSAWPRDRQQVKVLEKGGQLDLLMEELKRKRSDDPIPKEKPPIVDLAELKMRLVRGEFLWQLAAGKNRDPDARLLQFGIFAATGRVVEVMGLSNNPGEPKSAQLDWLRAWLAVQAGDLQTAQRSIAAGKNRNPSPTTKFALEQLEQLLVK